MNILDRIKKAKEEGTGEYTVRTTAPESDGMSIMSRINRAKRDKTYTGLDASTRTVTTAQEPTKATALKDAADIFGNVLKGAASTLTKAAGKAPRSTEEIRADIDDAQKRLDLFNKTTQPLFEASWHRQSRQEAQSQMDALKAEWKEATGWDYDEYNTDNRSLLQKILDPILDVGGDAAMSGVGQFVTGVANTGDLLLGKPLEAVGWKNNPASVGADIMNQYNAEISKQLSETAKAYKVPQKAAEALSAAVAAAPMAIMAYLTGGASAASTATLGATAASQGMNTAQMAGQAVSQMMKDPNYWTAFLQETGNNFREAQEWAGSDDKAAIYAITVGLINSGIEVGLDGASGIQGFEKAVRQGNTAPLRDFLKSSAGEGVEEIEQGLVSRGLGQLFGSGAKTFSVTDPDAVINPKTMAEEGAMGAAVGALLSGGTYAINSVVNRVNSANQGQGKQTAQTRPIVDEIMENLLGPVETQEKAPAQSRGEEQIAEMMDAIMGPAETEGQAEAPRTIEERRAEISRRYEGLNARAEEVIRDRENGADTSETEQELLREYSAIESDRKALDAEETQQRRIAANQTSKGINTPENHIDQREYDEVSKTSVKAFQFDHPELHDYFAEAARALMADTEFAIATTYSSYGDGTTFKSTHQLDRAIRLGLTKPEILKICEDIIANNGQENYAKAKKVEIILNDMLTYGYVGTNGEVSPNEAYIAAKEKINGADTAEDRYVKSNQLLIDLGDVTEDEARKEFRARMAENEQKKSAPEGGNTRLSDIDEADYMRTGSRPHIKASKQAAVNAGEKIVLTTNGETQNYIRTAINGDTENLIPKAYGKVGSAMADDIYSRSSGAFDVEGWYLELVPSDLRHAYLQHRDAKQSGNIPLTEADFLNIPDYIDTYDDILECKTFKNGEKEIVLGKKINGYSVIVEIVSNSRKSLSFKNMWGVDTAKYEAKYENSLEYRPSRSSETANDSKGTHNDAVLSDSIPQSAPSVNPETQNDGLGAADRGFAASDYNSWVENAESFHPEGENAVRNPSLPTKNIDGANTSKVGQSVMEAANTPDERVIDIQNQYINGKLTIASRTNESLVKDAVIEYQNDPKKALNDWTKSVASGKVSNELVAMGAVLLDSESIKANPALWMDVLTSYVNLGSTAGQALQAQRIFKALSPEGRLYMVKKTAQMMTNDVGTQISISDEDAGGVLRARTDEEMNAALDRIYKHLAEQIPSTFKDKWTALRYMNMLGNFKTQIRNLMGNTLMNGMRTVKNEVATGIEAVAARRNPNLERTQSARVGKAWMDAAKADFENVKEAALGNGRYDDTSRTAVEQEIQSRRRIFKSRTLEGYRKITNWATNAGDEVFIKHHYARALAGYLKANGVQVEQFLEGNVDSQLLSRATDFAIKEAQEATFHDNNAFSDWVSKLGRRESTPKAIKVIGEGVAPFRKTPANVLVRAYEYSPVGLIDTVSKAVKAGKGKATASDVINSAARVLTGSGIMALGMALRAAGYLRGTGNDDDEAIDSLMNRQDYSIVIPGVGSYTIDWLTPATMPLFMGANLWDIIDSEEMSLADIDAVLAKFTEPILETSMLSGVNDAINNIRFSENHLMQTAATYALSYATQGLTNSLFGQIERTAEPNRMTTYTSGDNPMPDWLERIVGQASAKIPGLDFQQTEYRDEFGKAESNGDLIERIFENIFSPGYWTPTHEGEQLYDELQDLHDETGENPWPDASPPKSFTAGGEKYTLDQEAKEKYQQTQGDIYTDLGGQVLSKGKRLFTPEEMVDILANIKSYAGTQAKKEFYEDHDIGADTTVNFIGKAVAGVQEAGIPFVTYLDFWCKKDKLDYEVDEKGKKKVKEAVVKLIDSMKLTDAQKDWLYNEEGYKGDVTWH